MKRSARLVFRTILNLTLIYCLFLVQTAFAAPDPRDSVIIESKTVEPAVGKPATRVRVFITNKDSILGFSLSLVERSISGGAYMNLAWPRTWDSIVTPLTNTLHGFKAFNGQRYTSTHPDTFLLWGNASSPFEGLNRRISPGNLSGK